MSSIAVLKDPLALPAEIARPVLAIGNFDGIHRGHGRLMDGARALGDKLAAPVGVLTFEPHSRVFVRPDEPFFPLTSAAEKVALLQSAGMAAMVVLGFDSVLKGMSAAGFAEELLSRRLGVAGVAVGTDFRYGRGREGDASRLVADGERLGFEVFVLENFAIRDRIVSSTSVREALMAGAVDVAADLLGRWWSVAAEVAHGDKRGREFGFPTANMILDLSCKLAHGIYAVRACVEGVGRFDGAASFGRRPTFDDAAPRLETYLFDFAGDIYGRRMTVEFISRIRGEERFASIDALIARMHEDVAAAKEILAAPPRGIGGPIASVVAG